MKRFQFTTRNLLLAVLLVAVLLSCGIPWLNELRIKSTPLSWSLAQRNMALRLSTKNPTVIATYDSGLRNGGIDHRNLLETPKFRSLAHREGIEFVDVAWDNAEFLALTKRFYPELTNSGEYVAFYLYLPETDDLTYIKGLAGEPPSDELIMAEFEHVPNPRPNSAE